MLAVSEAPIELSRSGELVRSGVHIGPCQQISLSLFASFWLLKLLHFQRQRERDIYIYIEYIHTYIYTRTHTHTHTHTYGYTRGGGSPCLFTCLHVCMFMVLIPTYIYIYIFASIYMLAPRPHIYISPFWLSGRTDLSAQPA